MAQAASGTPSVTEIANIGGAVAQTLIEAGNAVGQDIVTNMGCIRVLDEARNGE